MGDKDARGAPKLTPTQVPVAPEGIGKRSVGGTLAALLSLTSDGVVIFDGAGRILFANDEAIELLGHEKTVLGADIRKLFASVATDLIKEAVLDSPFDTKALPFSFDASATYMSCVGADGRLREIIIRADRVNAPGETYLLVASPAAGTTAVERENERLLDEISRANRRLSGTLAIVLGSIDSKDVTSLFSRVLDNITNTLEASGALLYLAEARRYRLRGVSGNVDRERVPRRLMAKRSLERMALEAGGALRLRVLEPSLFDLRQGRLRMREILNEDTRETRHVPSSALPPFSSFLFVPVWFGGHVIAALEVGWEHARQIAHDDARLLDAVGQYLSVQFAGALSTLRQQRTAELSNAGAKLRHMFAGEELSRQEEPGARIAEDICAASASVGKVSKEICTLLSTTLECEVIPVHENRYQPQTVVATFPHQGDCELPLPVARILDEGASGAGGRAGGRAGSADDGDLTVAIVSEGTPLGDWLIDRGEPSQGAFVDLGEAAGERRCLLLVRKTGADPFDELELAFLRRLADDARDAARGVEARDRDRHISLALQTGMRNELQKVDGVTAAGIYSSATQAAFVGGDFYDMIRLPDRHACVIMGDVSGKGVEAASVAAAVKTALGAYSWEGLRPARMVRLLNEFLLGFSRMETFATLFVGIIDLAAGQLTYCSAGHPPAIFVRAATGELQMLDVQSGVVGAFTDMDYRNGRVRIDPGDVLFLYTDGTTEARAADGTFFGEVGLRDAIMTELPRGFDGLLDRMLTRLDEFTARRLDDDVAMVALRFDIVR